MPWNRPDLRRVLSSALLVAGVALLIYVGLQYGSMYRGQQRLARKWQEQQQAMPAPETSKSVAASDLLTRLTIPKIDLDSVVVEGTTRHDLLLGPGHMEDTAVPGDDGNAVITGHRDTFFRHIYELNKGDSVLVQRGGKTYKYEVTGKKVIEPDDLSVVRPSKEARLTLITCYPTYYIGPAPKRLVVFTKMVADQATTPISLKQGRSAALGR